MPGSVRCSVSVYWSLSSLFVRDREPQLLQSCRFSSIALKLLYFVGIGGLWPFVLSPLKRISLN